jgi:acetyl esterase/lipase
MLPIQLARAEKQPPIVLFPNGAPGALGTADKDVPTLTPYLPDKASATGTAIVVCPGGGYTKLAPHEGEDYALFLNQHGIAAFVLKYRLGADGYRHPCELQDAARALRTVRTNAENWGVDPKRVGMMGSSAGGHLTATLLTHFDAGDPNASDPIDRVSSRPDFGILCYAVISFDKFAHLGSRKALLGENPSPELVKSLSAELQVTPDTPPCFIWHTWEDKTVPVENALLLAQALREKSVPFDLHIYEHGRHGLGLADKPPFAHPHPWANDLLFWLQGRGLIKAPTTQSAQR